MVHIGTKFKETLRLPIQLYIIEIVGERRWILCATLHYHYYKYETDFKITIVV